VVLEFVFTPPEAELPSQDVYDAVQNKVPGPEQVFAPRMPRDYTPEQNEIAAGDLMAKLLAGFQQINASQGARVDPSIPAAFASSPRSRLEEKMKLDNLAQQEAESQMMMDPASPRSKLLQEYLSQRGMPGVNLPAGIIEKEGLIGQAEINKRALAEAARIAAQQEAVRLEKEKRDLADFQQKKDLIDYRIMAKKNARPTGGGTGVGGFSAKGQRKAQYDLGESIKKDLQDPAKKPAIMAAYGFKEEAIPAILAQPSLLLGQLATSGSRIVTSAGVKHEGDEDKLKLRFEETALQTANSIAKNEKFVSAFSLGSQTTDLLDKVRKNPEATTAVLRAGIDAEDWLQKVQSSLGRKLAKKEMDIYSQLRVLLQRYKRDLSGAAIGIKEAKELAADLGAGVLSNSDILTSRMGAFKNQLVSDIHTRVSTSGRGGLLAAVRASQANPWYKPIARKLISDADMDFNSFLEYDGYQPEVLVQKGENKVYMRKADADRLVKEKPDYKIVEQ
ncbi:MAG: hypothetical protein MN733_32510, partial [Nitrososphaera sp.]|nr:hypothetical protein [Nitrososphaera sp.]